ncbi:MscS Mechanosensitive ion channel [Reticulomyxa filosa]|uniref:MscS Mechanosensitive ion channel n=1 Tax=Reticulomyxa filosa TaxID=46433 RepID=X6MUZ9_RETFI|nr:MscS Mechanosensitive ion channel [Reticulomyxa filosa]|eukprot:ETO16905.1 MscS Mechanosensitive ion channel [Reticulomyxa filosa]
MWERTDEELGHVLQLMRRGLEVKNRKWWLHTYPNCWIGSEAVKWMLSHKDELEISNEAEALALGNLLMKKGKIQHVVREHQYKNGYLFYQFVDDCHEPPSLQWSQAEVTRVAFDVFQNVEIKDRQYHFKLYPQCFIGTQAVQYLIHANHASSVRLRLTMTSKSHIHIYVYVVFVYYYIFKIKKKKKKKNIYIYIEAVAIGRQLVRHKIIAHVTNDHDFKNEELFYRFIPSKFLTIATATQSTTPKTPRTPITPTALTTPTFTGGSIATRTGGSVGGLGTRTIPSSPTDSITHTTVDITYFGKSEADEQSFLHFGAHSNAFTAAAGSKPQRSSHNNVALLTQGKLLTQYEENQNQKGNENEEEQQDRANKDLEDPLAEKQLDESEHFADPRITKSSDKSHRRRKNLSASLNASNQRRKQHQSLCFVFNDAMENRSEGLLLLEKLSTESDKETYASSSDSEDKKQGHRKRGSSGRDDRCSEQANNTIGNAMDSSDSLTNRRQLPSTSKPSQVFHLKKKKKCHEFGVVEKKRGSTT